MRPCTGPSGAGATGWRYSPGWLSSGGVAHDALLLALPVPFLGGVPLVVVGLALGQGDLALHHVLLPVQGEGDTGVALLLYGTGNAVDFPLVEQQFAGSIGLGHKVGRCGLQGGDQGVQQPGFAVFEKYIAVGELGLAGPQTFYLPALQGQAGLELIFEIIVVPGSPILRDGAGAGCGFAGCVSHGAIIPGPWRGMI